MCCEMGFDSPDQGRDVELSPLDGSFRLEGSRRQAARAEERIDGQDEGRQSDKDDKRDSPPPRLSLAGSLVFPILDLGLKRVTVRRAQEHARRFVAGGIRARLVQEPALKIALNLGKPQLVQIERRSVGRRLEIGSPRQGLKDRQHGYGEHRGEDEIQDHGPLLSRVASLPKAVQRMIWRHRQSYKNSMALKPWPFALYPPHAAASGSAS